jgi:hypothetical protein
MKHLDNKTIDVDLNNINIKDLCITIENKDNLTKNELDDYFVKITNTFLKISTIQSTLDNIKNNLFSQLNLLENINSSLKNQEDNFDILNDNNKNTIVDVQEEKVVKAVVKRGRKKKTETEEKKEVKKRGRKKKELI